MLTPAGCGGHVGPHGTLNISAPLRNPQAMLGARPAAAPLRIPCRRAPPAHKLRLTAAVSTRGGVGYVCKPAGCEADVGR